MGSDGTTGVHRFAITDGGDDDNNHPYHAGVRDEILPFPGSAHLETPLKAVHWSLVHLSRAAVRSPWSVGPAVDLLRKYLTNILDHPGEWKYRSLKISGKKFGTVWAVPPLRGVLLAAGFVEDRGVCRLGRSDRPLRDDRIQEVALLSYLLGEWKRKQDEHDNSTPDTAEQPHGAADGFGRAGFGRAG